MVATLFHWVFIQVVIEIAPVKYLLHFKISYANNAQTGRNVEIEFWRRRSAVTNLEKNLGTERRTILHRKSTNASRILKVSLQFDISKKIMLFFIKSQYATMEVYRNNMRSYNGSYRDRNDVRTARKASTGKTWNAVVFMLQWGQRYVGEIEAWKARKCSDSQHKRYI